MREVVLQFEDPEEAPATGRAGGDPDIRGVVVAPDRPDQPMPFDGWLHLLGILEQLSLTWGVRTTVAAQSRSRDGRGPGGGAEQPD